MAVKDACLSLYLFVALALLGNFCFAQQTSSDTRRLVLVSSSHADIPQLAPTQVRKLYLGAPLVMDGKRIEPLRNTSDRLLYEVFLQKIVFMSARSYERQLLSQVFRGGGGQPQAYENTDDLSNALKNNPYMVSYMWSDTVAERAGLKVIQELWQGATP